MNHYFITKTQLETDQIIISYMEDQQKLTVYLPQRDNLCVHFNVPRVNSAFFDTLAQIGQFLLFNDEEPIKSVAAFENSKGIVIGLNDKIWTLEHPPEGDTTPNPPT